MSRRRLFLLLASLLLVILHGWAFSRPWLHSIEPLLTWRKGPLVNETSPYSSYHAARYLWPAVVLMLDAWILAALAWFRWGKRVPVPDRLQPVVPALVLLTVLAGAEWGVRASIRQTAFTQYRPDPELLWYNRPGLREHSDRTDPTPKSTNSLGFRGPDDVPRGKEPGEIRIFVLGDSSTFGLGVMDHQTYSHVLQETLREITGRPVRVMNAGSPGHSSVQGKVLWERHGVRLGTDILILAYNNDSCLDMLEDRQRVTANPALLAMERAFYKSDLFLLGRQAVLDAFYARRLDDFRETYPSEQQSWVRRVSMEDYRALLHELESSAQELGARTLFVEMPVNRPTIEQQPIYATSFSDEYRDYLAWRFCHAPGRTCAMFEQAFLNPYDPSLFLPGHLFHPSPVGHRIIGESLARTIAEEGLLPPSPEGVAR